MKQILQLWFPKEEILLKQSGIDTAGIFFREAANQYDSISLAIPGPSILLLLLLITIKYTLSMESEIKLPLWIKMNF
jgi:hypothetical protein